MEWSWHSLDGSDDDQAGLRRTFEEHGGYIAKRCRVLRILSIFHGLHTDNFSITVCPTDILD